ncbi:MAG: DUF58 domain-containing protein [Opitutae bacterium]|nr:DUF58 domain-containing protein [Opitutae bacterium]
MASVATASPRRFWRRLLWSLVFPRARQRIQPTVSGTILIALALCIGTAAYNSANNILFITLSLLLACLVLSGVLSWLNLRGIRWRLQAEPPWRVGEETTVALALHNGKRVLPTYGLWFDFKAVPETPVAEDAPPATAARPKRTRERPLREILAAADRAVTRGRRYLGDRLPPGGDVPLHWNFTPMRRGRVQLAVENVGSLFPFGFLRKSHALDLCRDLVVWPAPVEYRRWGGVAARLPSPGERIRRTGNSADLLALRRYAPGDSHRLIHWKASARTRQLLVRQFGAESQEGYALRFEPAAELWPRAEQFELAVSFAGTLAEDLFRAGRLQAVALGAEPPFAVRRGADLETFLDRLAVVERTPGPASALSTGTAPGHRNLITFAPEGARTVAAYVDGQKTAST